MLSKSNRLSKKRILVTGANGFIGSHLVKRLVSEGFQVYSLHKSKKIINNEIKVKKVLYGDISNWKFIENIFKIHEFSVCFHLASQAFVELGAENPLQTLKSNIDGTIHILEAARRYELNRVIVASTTHVYGDNKNIPYKEYYTPRPSRIYETSKTCSDIIAQSYIASFNQKIFIPRFVNIYGPGDINFNRIIPKTIKSILNNEAPSIWGGTAVRDFLYIDDAIEAYLKLLEVDMKRNENHIFNFGSNNIISIKDLVQKIIQLSGKKMKVKIETSLRKNEIKNQYVSWSKAKRILKWTPKTSFNDGLIHTLQWYKQYLSSK